jgi:hypothetical protein
MILNVWLSCSQHFCFHQISFVRADLSREKGKGLCPYFPLGYYFSVEYPDSSLRFSQLMDGMI